MMRAEPMRLVLVEWVDSFGCSASWQDIDDVSAAAPLVCRSVGWLLQDTDDCKVVVPHLSDSSHAHAARQGCGDMTIPTRSVLSMVSLEPSHIVLFMNEFQQRSTVGVDASARGIIAGASDGGAI